MDKHHLIGSLLELEIINKLNVEGIAPLFIKFINIDIPIYHNNIDILVSYDDLLKPIKVLKRFNYMYIISAKKNSHFIYT